MALGKTPGSCAQKQVRWEQCSPGWAQPSVEGTEQLLLGALMEHSAARREKIFLMRMRGGLKHEWKQSHVRHAKGAKGTLGPGWQAAILLFARNAPVEVAKGSRQHQKENPAGYGDQTIVQPRARVPGALQPLPRASSSRKSQ